MLAFLRVRIVVVFLAVLSTITYCVTQSCRSVWWIIRLYMYYNGPIRFVHLCNFVCVLYNLMCYISKFFLLLFRLFLITYSSQPIRTINLMIFCYFRCLFLWICSIQCFLGVFLINTKAKMLQNVSALRRVIWLQSCCLSFYTPSDVGDIWMVCIDWDSCRLLSHRYSTKQKNIRPHWWWALP